MGEYVIHPRMAPLWLFGDGLLPIVIAACVSGIGYFDGAAVSEVPPLVDFCFESKGARLLHPHRGQRPRHHVRRVGRHLIGQRPLLRAARDQT